jgi:glycosyltransferase involved in cell wall biosynthesis
MNKIGICGHYGEGKSLLNGQTIKTKILTDELARQLDAHSISIVDTHNWKANPFKLFFQCINLIRNSEYIIILPAMKGVKVFVPLFLFSNFLFKRKLHYVVIGGWLPELLKSNRKLKNQLKQFDGIYVETHTMIELLSHMGFKNVFYMPNFKPIKVLTEDELMYPKNPYKLCTFSRVMKEKGIEDAINAVKSINEKYNEVLFSLDIYGQIEKGYEKDFGELQQHFPDYISYQGLVDFDKSTNILKNYFSLLFPTYYEGEGFPGTVIDAFSSGLPVIATNWKYNSEVIQHGQTGLIYEGGVEGLVFTLNEILSIPNEIMLMKRNCIIEAQKYNPESVVGTFIVHISEGEKL